MHDDERDFGRALLKIAARFASEVAERLDRAGEKLQSRFSRLACHVYRGRAPGRCQWSSSSPMARAKRSSLPRQRDCKWKRPALR
ncbi:MAG: hypothetical protein U1E63_15890 [Burkholderiales bacterium]